MKHKLALLLMPVVLLLPVVTQAKNEMLKFPIAGALESADAKEKLNGSVKFFFGDQKHPAPVRDLGTRTSNKKTNAFNKSDNEACDRAFLSALITFQETALRDGGNAVINLKSVTKNEDFSSETEYACNTGTFTGGVALRGDIVKLP